jgi:16S rRNA (adenine1518-N6/adenine1519-N6)-dimethyltransferase
VPRESAHPMTDHSMKTDSEAEVPASTEAASAKAELQRHGLRAKRTLGQNFLTDRGLCEKIAALVAPAGQGVLEIGAGLGALTAPLLARGSEVLAIETDRSLSTVLREKFATELAGGKLRLMEADAREVDLAQCLDTLGPSRTLAGNLPYQLSGLLLRRAVELAGACQRLVFLLQLEVVDRMCAAPDTAQYGALSVFVQSVYRPQRAFIVRRGAFYPQPGVDSAVVLLEPLTATVQPPSAEFALLVRAGFEKRRKTLRNAWRGIGLPTEQLAQLAETAGINLDARGETLSVDAFARMAAALQAQRAEPR